jgi:aspartyl-tRNA(Asn)/glutamyl-tRNA(Gln) amidotransferase subunit C
MVTERDVLHVASLARLGLSPAQVPQLVAELNGILAHMEILAAVATDAAPSSVAGMGAGEDGARDDNGRQRPLAVPRDAFAPESRDGFFLVPRLATHGDEEG